MGQNKNDQGNQQSDNKSNQKEIEAFKKKVTDPNNPTAKQNKQKDEEANSKHPHSSIPQEREPNRDFQDKHTDEK
jgi:hypothetical protein